jgi:hypothetical protein
MHTAFPSFGSERTGSPVDAFYHLSDKENPHPRADQGPRRTHRAGSDAVQALDVIQGL